MLRGMLSRKGKKAKATQTHWLRFFPWYQGLERPVNPFNWFILHSQLKRCSIYVLQIFGENLAKALAKVSLLLKARLGGPFVRVSELADEGEQGTNTGRKNM